MTEENKTRIAFDFTSMKLTAFVIVWAVIMLSVFVLTIPNYGWTTLFFDSAIIVGAAIFLIVVYEYSSGNKFDLPKFDYKITIDAILRVAIMLLGIIIGSGAFVMGTLSIMVIFDTSIYVMLLKLFTGVTLMIFGSVFIVAGIGFIKPLLMIEEEKEDIE